MTAEVTQDGFLGGRLTIAQPRHGFRAGHDSVLLAATIPAKAGERILEFGSGVGVASLCLAARVANCEILGIEIDWALVALANDNAKRNGLNARFVAGDAREAKSEGAPFDHVFFNPPFHPDTGQVSLHAARDRATRDTDDAVRSWTERALQLVKAGGTVTAILRADRLEDFLSVTGKRGVVVLPLLPSAGDPPKRVIVQLRMGDPAPLATMAGFPLHEDGRPTHGAEAVLRHAAALPIY